MSTCGPRVFGGDKKGTCPACDALGIIGIRWPNPQDRRSDAGRNAAEIASQLQFTRKLKHGELHECRQCGRWWYHNEDMLQMDRVSSSRRELLEEWDVGRFVPTDAAVETMRAIGATGCDAYGNGRGEWRVPCAVTWTDGTVSDPCVIVISKRPPLYEWRARVALLENVSAIAPSLYALPREVRVATYNASEVRMGFSPTLAEQDDGSLMVLNGPEDVLACGRLIGSDVRLAAPGTKYQLDMPIVLGNPEQTTFVYCDWFPSCKELAIPNDWTPGRAWDRVAHTERGKSGGILGIIRRMFSGRR